VNVLTRISTEGHRLGISIQCFLKFVSGKRPARQSQAPLNRPLASNRYDRHSFAIATVIGFGAFFELYPMRCSLTIGCGLFSRSSEKIGHWYSAFPHCDRQAVLDVSVVLALVGTAFADFAARDPLLFFVPLP